MRVSLRRQEAIAALRNALPYGRKSINKAVKRLQRRFEKTLQIIVKEVKDKLHIFFGNPDMDGDYGKMVISVTRWHVNSFLTYFENYFLKD